ncbi:MAG: alpha/beta hydrolase [Sphingobacteriales bacterium]|nr:MAG: alpha/beta hydrolase [Sphingobacteriales bacterium]
MVKSLTYKKGRISYSVYGEGKPVLLIHGFAEDSNIWENQVTRFSKMYKLIVPDLPGSGKSDFIPEVFTMEDHADMLVEILRAENTETADIIGHSMGGYIALAFAEKYPEMMNTICLFHSSSYADTEEKIGTRKKAIQFIKQNGSLKFLEQATPNLFSDHTKQQRPELVPEIIDRYSNFNPNSLVHYYEAMIQRPDRSEILRKIAKPVLIIAGDHDTAVPPKHSLEQSYLPELSYFQALKNSGHMGMLEEPGESNQVLGEFLNGTLTSYVPVFNPG